MYTSTGTYEKFSFFERGGLSKGSTVFKILPDCTPYGTLLDGRHGNETAYRYGYQGSEKDDELKGSGNSYTTQFRMLDPRIGRWFSTDPIAHPWQSPYSSMDNSPILTNDKLGLYGEKRAQRIAERARKHGSDAYVSHNTEGKKGWSVTITKEYNGETYSGVFVTGNFTSIDDQLFWEKGASEGGLGEADIDFYEAKSTITLGKQKSIDADYAKQLKERAAWERKIRANCKAIDDFAEACLYEAFWTLTGEELAVGLYKSVKWGYNAAKGTKATQVVVKTEQVATKMDNVVYHSVDEGVTQYVGITDNLARRSAQHLSKKGIRIEPLMQGLSRADARAVEQTLIEIHGLSKNGGTLINKINSIATSNPTYGSQLRRGYELLKSIGY
jgi:RHS repeat-associated protein